MLCAAELFHQENNYKNHSQDHRKSPQDQKLMRKGVILGHSHTLDHCLKIQGKRKNHHGSHSQNLCCLSRRNSKDPFGLTFHQNNIGKKYNSSCYHKVNNKIPEIRPVEHTEKHCRQKDLSKIVEKDLLKDPGLHRSLFADFFSSTLSGLVGSVPTTTYGENIGVMAMTKVYSVQVIGGAAVLSICCSFLGKLAALINTIPGPVIGGISFLLYGMIGTSGLRMLVDNQVDYGKSRNLALTSVVFIVGLSGIALNLGNVKLTGMVLACVVAMILSLVFYVLDKLHLTNDL